MRHGSLRRRDVAERCGQLLTALSHRGVLARGFALVRDLEGHPLRQAAQVSAGMRLDVEFSDGHVRAYAEGSDDAARDPQANRAGNQAARSAWRRRSGQGSLFDK